MHCSCAPREGPTCVIPKLSLSLCFDWSLAYQHVSQVFEKLLPIPVSLVIDHHSFKCLLPGLPGPVTSATAVVPQQPQAGSRSCFCPYAPCTQLSVPYPPPTPPPPPHPASSTPTGLCTGVGDAGLKQLSTLTSLTNLNLDSRLFTDVGMRYIQGLTNLVALDLFAAKISDIGCGYFRLVA